MSPSPYSIEFENGKTSSVPANHVSVFLVPGSSRLILCVKGCCPTEPFILGSRSSPSFSFLGRGKKYVQGR